MRAAEKSRRGATKSSPNIRRGRPKRDWLDPGGYGWCYLFLAPTLLLYLTFILWPTVASWYFAFFNWDGVGWPSRFVGLENFRQVAADPFFWGAFRNSWTYSAAILLIQVPLALVVAVVLNDPKLRARTVYRTLFFLPVVTTTAVVGIVLAIMFSPVGGPLNQALLGLNLIDRPINFLGAARLALPTIIAVGIWKTFGTNLIYWLAGLQSVPGELYEAARLDGAGSWQIMRFITLPMLRPVALTICFLALIHSLNVFDLVQVMTRGGPFFASDVVGTYIFRIAFSAEQGVPRFGFASAAGVFFGLTNFLIVIVQVLAINASRRKRSV